MLQAMMDISDGLSTDLNRICMQSGVGAILEASQIPLSEAALQKPDPLPSALHDGEDFELLFTIASQDFDKAKASIPLQITKIGVITEVPDMWIVLSDGKKKELRPGGYDHL